MQTTLTAIIKKDGGWWVGWVEEIPGANAQEKTKEKLIASLKEAAQDIIDIYRESSMQQAEQDYEEVYFAI